MTERIVVVTGDLMDRSKISAAIDDAVFARGVALAIEASPELDLAVVDLRVVSADDIATLVARGVRVVAFGSHVDEATLDDARSAGAEALPRSVFFRRVADGRI